MRQTSIQLDDETARQMAWLAEQWGLPEQRHVTAVIQRMAQQVYALEAARRCMSDSELLGFIAELYPAEGA